LVRPAVSQVLHPQDTTHHQGVDPPQSPHLPAKLGAGDEEASPEEASPEEGYLRLLDHHYFDLSKR
jgi:hypothetical protein